MRSHVLIYLSEDGPPCKKFTSGAHQVVLPSLVSWLTMFYQLLSLVLLGVAAAEQSIYVDDYDQRIIYNGTWKLTQVCGAVVQ